MSKLEVLEKMMNSENGSLYAAIGAIVTVYGIDRITRSRYRFEANKESLTMAPAAEQEKKPTPEKLENAQ